MKALAPALPRQVSGGIGNLRVIAFSGLRDGQHWVHMEIFEGSYGGRHGLDGMDAVDTLYANTRNNPIEDIESHLPLRVNRYELREDACAAGRWRGGMGSIREFTYLSEGGASVEGDGHKSLLDKVVLKIFYSYSPSDFSNTNIFYFVAVPFCKQTKLRKL